MLQSVLLRKYFMCRGQLVAGVSELRSLTKALRHTTHTEFPDTMLAWSSRISAAPLFHLLCVSARIAA